MDKYQTHQGLVAPLDRSNVDTDAIIPKQFLKSISRTGFGPFLFDEWRYLDHGEPGMDCSGRSLNQDFILNKKRYMGSTILLTRANFGCGSSREHAPWALKDYGFKVIIAESYADIFYNNCFKNGILPIKLAADQLQSLFDDVAADEGYSLTVNLEDQTIDTRTDRTIPFKIDDYNKFCLMNGLDEIGATLEFEKDIKAFEVKHQHNYPWLFEGEVLSV